MVEVLKNDTLMKMLESNDEEPSEVDILEMTA